MNTYEYSYMMEELLGTGVLSGILGSIPSLLFSIASYVLTSMALYTIARRRGLRKPWLAWIPVVNAWIVGSLSDQYRYVVKGENKSKRKLLVVLSILASVLSIVVVVCAVSMVAEVMIAIMNGMGEAAMEAYLLNAVMGPMIGILGLCMPLVGVAIAYAIIRYMALYDIYKSLDPSNCVLFLVLSILFNATEPFFLFFNRNKDLGMPPRRQENIHIPEQEPWETENKDYL